MSKEIARSEQSYLNEQIVTAMVPELLRAKGFVDAEVYKRGNMKLIRAVGDGSREVVFWLKQGWTGRRGYSAIQFGMIEDSHDPKSEPAERFIKPVADVVASAVRQGATHALLVHMRGSVIGNYVALEINDVLKAYQRQIEGWPVRARNNKMPTLFFEDSRRRPDAECVSAVTDLEVSLEDLAVAGTALKGRSPEPGVEKVTAEVERRLRQQRFRVLVGERYGWRCAVTGLTVRQVLDAAHLPGRDWRTDNEATDGILLRVDLHRLVDQRLAEIRGERFWVAEQARVDEYALLHDSPVIPPTHPVV